MKITDEYLAFLCLASYDPNSVWTNAWIDDKDGIYVTHLLVQDENGEDVDIIVFRGSQTFLDWLRDLDAIPHKHPLLGWCHSGFLRYMDLVFEQTMAVVGKRIIITGHSLGAARASILTGLYAVNGSPIEARVVFGEPHSGFKQLATILQQSGAELRSYRNNDDPVTEVPLFVMPLLQYVHASPLIKLSEPRAPGDLELLHDHHMPLYYSGIKKYLSGIQALVKKSVT
jgi:Lipase (class 3)